MFVRGLVKGMEWLLMSILGTMVLLVFGNVVLRYGFNSGIVFSEEVSRFLFVWMVFLGSGLMLRDNGDISLVVQFSRCKRNRHLLHALKALNVPVMNALDFVPHDDEDYYEEIIEPVEPVIPGLSLKEPFQMKIAKARA